MANTQSEQNWWVNSGRTDADAMVDGGSVKLIYVLKLFSK